MFGLHHQLRKENDRMMSVMWDDGVNEENSNTYRFKKRNQEKFSKHFANEGSDVFGK